MDEVLKKFKDCDENDDGKLSAGECVNQWTGDGPNFNEVDADGDGEVTWEEMKAAAAAIITEDRAIGAVLGPLEDAFQSGMGKGEGDCDYDRNCRGNLKCGDSNCKYIWGSRSTGYKRSGWQISPVGTYSRCTSKRREDSWWVACDDCCE